MRRALILASLSAITLCAGCATVVMTCLVSVAGPAILGRIMWDNVVTLHPLWSPEVAAQDGRIEGDWVSALGDEGDEVWTVAAIDGGYEIRSTVKGASSETAYFAVLVKLGDSLYLDLQSVPTKFDPTSISGHLLLRLELGEDQARLSFCDRAKLEKMLGEDGSPLAGADMDTSLVLTSKTPALQEFFREHGHEVIGRSMVPLRRK